MHKCTVTRVVQPQVKLKGAKDPKFSGKVKVQKAKQQSIELAHVVIDHGAFDFHFNRLEVHR